VGSNVIMKWPAAMMLPPMITARLLPSQRSAITPPRIGVKYAIAV
jgi:hypothetical protein